MYLIIIPLSAEIVVTVDTIVTCRLEGGFKTYFIDEKPLKHATLWHGGTRMAPFDKEFYVTIGVGVGGIHDFTDNLPWHLGDAKTLSKFWRSVKDDPNWLKPSNAAMEIDYIRIYAV